MLPEDEKFLNDLSAFIPQQQIIKDDLLTYAFGVDASFYSLTPKMVIIVENEHEAAKVISACSTYNIPYTFRAAGTSLSGQALTDSVLLKLGSSFSKIDIEDQGTVVKLQPAVSGGEVNRQLLRYNRKLGPDPASSNVAKIGGIIANNASGMTSGVVNNSYNTLQDIKIIFYDGTLLDTADSQSVSRFKESHKELIARINILADRVKGNNTLSEKIKNKYKIKNTCGYGLNALVDYSDPVDIIAHLMVGSEGTLAFIAGVTLKTVENFPYKATTFLLFRNIVEACKTIPLLQADKVDSAELMDYAALKSVKDLPGIPFDVSRLPEDAAALLVEISAGDSNLLTEKQQSLSDRLEHLALLNKAQFTTDPLERARIWKIRKGLFPTGCKNRETGSTVIIEDLNFPIDKLAQAVADIQVLLKKYNYLDSFIWGHALSGNIHFVLTQKFDSNTKIENYDSFMQEIVKLVVDKYDGSLKAEHGTGRNMAPFVKYEWGSEAYAVMQEIKTLFDPKNIINPGVLLNNDPQIHLKNIKIVNTVHEKIDKCTDCGFCEKICPSKNFTVTPRQRISLFRKEIGSKPLNAATLQKLSEKFQFNVNDSCAADGMCQTECPVDINVGDWIKDVRHMQKSGTASLLATLISKNFSLTTAGLRLAIKSITLGRKIFGKNIFDLLNKIASTVSFGIIPRWHSSFPSAAGRFNREGTEYKKEILYFPCCINRIFGSYAHGTVQKHLSDTISNVVRKAGYNLKIAKGSDALCCGMAFASKGFYSQADQMSEKLRLVITKDLTAKDSLVLFDTTPCAIHMQEYLRKNNSHAFHVLDPIEFIHSHLKNNIPLKKLSEPIAIHPVCSAKKQGLQPKLQEIAGWCSENVVVTEPVGCCGFAGDKGINMPELNKAALAELPYTEIKSCSAGFSTSRMCEIGLSRESGLSFDSLFFLIEKSANQ